MTQSNNWFDASYIYLLIGMSVWGMARACDGGMNYFVKCSLLLSVRPRESGDPELQQDILIQIPPCGVFFFNHLKFPASIPFLDLTLAQERRFARIMLFVPNKHLDAVLLREARNDAFTVLPYARRKVVRHSNVQRSVSTVRNQVNIKGHRP